ncbi:MAG: ubiquinol-cytochrome c reductase iron-sulfur subunit [Vicinamibacteria bacterium]
MKEVQTRREFCSHACQAVSLAAFAGALGTVLQGCSSGGSSPTGPSGVGALPLVNGTLTGNTVTVTVDAASPIAAVGGAALVQTIGGFLLVAQTAQGTFVALNGTCTHQACTITGFGSGTYVCPCHGSQFTTSGRVIAGPAPANLQQFQTQFANNVLTITV